MKELDERIRLRITSASFQFQFVFSLHTMATNYHEKTKEDKNVLKAADDFDELTDKINFLLQYANHWYKNEQQS